MVTKSNTEICPDIDNRGQTVPAAVQVLYRNIMETLKKHYPKLWGSWNVAIDTHGGVVQLRNTLLSGDMGFQINIVNIDAEGKAIRNAAGELLERYGVAREKGMSIRNAMQDLKFNRRGEAKYDE